MTVAGHMPLNTDTLIFFYSYTFRVYVSVLLPIVLKYQGFVKANPATQKQGTRCCGCPVPLFFCTLMYLSLCMRILYHVFPAVSTGNFWYFPVFRHINMLKSPH